MLAAAAAVLVEQVEMDRQGLVEPAAQDQRPVSLARLQHMQAAAEEAQLGGHLVLEDQALVDADQALLLTQPPEL
jgi:hypothetical protein